MNFSSVRLSKYYIEGMKRFITNVLRLLYSYYQLFVCTIFKICPIVIYQMGKVGSTTIYNALKKNGVKNVFIVHRMNPKHIHEVNKMRKRRLDVSDIIGIKIKELFIDKGKKVKIITPVREPISRNISAFFQNLEVHTRSKKKKTEITDIINDFFENYPHRTPLDWFDKEWKEVFNIDIYKYDFDKNKGYSIYKYKNFDLLVFKSELLDKDKEKLISDFLGVRNLKLVRKNIGEQKNYANLYKKFRKEINIPEHYSYNIHNSKYVNHFYDKKEIEKIKSEYQK